MTPRHRWPLALKLTVTTTAIAVAAVAAVSLASVYREERAFRTELEHQAEVLLDTVASSAADRLYVHDAAFLSKMVHSLVSSQSVDLARVYDSDGRIIADATQPTLALDFQVHPEGLRLAASERTTFEWHADHLVAGRGIAAGRKRLGAILVGLPTHALDDKIAAARSVGVGGALVASLLAIFLALFVSRSVTGPLRALTGAARRVATGDLSGDVAIQSSDELAELGGAFNAMTVQIRESTERARRHASELEQRVDERTADLVKASAFLEHLIEASPGVVFLVNPADFSVTYISPNVSQILGYKPEEIVGISSIAARLVYPEEIDRFLSEARRRVEERHRLWHFEYRVRHKDDGCRWFYFVMHYEDSLEGQPPSLLGYAMDITQRKQAEENLVIAQKAAEQANRAKSEFLSRISHELRTPLNSILGFAQLMDADSPRPEQRERLGYVLTAGRHLLQLINEVLDIARVESGRLHLSPEPVHIGEALDDALNLVRTLASERNVRLGENAPEIGDVYVRADRQRLKQVFLNLLSNAIKYNRDGGTVTATCEQAPGDRMRITVSDTGHGIPQEKMDRLFAPFERIGAERTDIEGTGLGLALSKRLVEAMNGSIGVESEVGRGSTFWVELPLTESPFERLIQVGDKGVAPASREAPVQPRTVLYIEDNLTNFRLIEHIMAVRPGIKLLPAMQGWVGLDLARQHRPDIALVDLHLPDIQGDEVLRRLQADSRTRGIPVIIISADATPGEVERLLAAGASAYLTKPIDTEELLKIMDATQSSRAEAPTRSGRP